MDKQQTRVGLLVRLSRPYLLAAGLLPLLLGTGIARYLNHQIDWSVFGLGLLWVFAVLLSAIYLHEYFDFTLEVDWETHTRFFGGSQVLGNRENQLPRKTALNAALAALTMVGALSILLLWVVDSGYVELVVMLLLLLLAVGYSVPPLMLSRSGYGELAVGIFFGSLLPAFGFVLQAGAMHRLITMVSLPLVMLVIPGVLALTFPTFAQDQKHKRGNMLQKVGWQNSMMIHNTLILLAYLSLAGAVLLGFPRSVGLMAYWAIPLGLAQIWLMGRIAAGTKPPWQALRFNVISHVSVFMFLLLYSFWT